MYTTNCTRVAAKEINKMARKMQAMTNGLFMVWCMKDERQRILVYDREVVNRLT